MQKDKKTEKEQVRHYAITDFQAELLLGSLKGLRDAIAEAETGIMAGSVGDDMLKELHALIGLFDNPANEPKRSN